MRRIIMATSDYKRLLSPIRIGNLLIKNRIFAAPASLNFLSTDSKITADAIAFYEAKAKGGAGLVTYGESIVHSATGKSHDSQVCLDDPYSLAGMAQLARAIKRHGAAASAELSHGGKYGGLVSLAGSASKAGKIAYGASAESTPEGEVLEMPHDLLLEVIESFGKGAAVLKRAGFDMCMVHAGHGWLFGQFLSEKTNRRTDEFGGSFENRARALVMALDSIKKHTGGKFPIEVRISGDEYIDGGITLEESINLAKYIEDKCDLINVSAGIHEGLEFFIRTHPSQFIDKGANVFLAEAVRKEVSIPISTVGGITDPALMESIIETGKADAIEFARPLLADPFFPNKLRDGREDEIVKCLRCNGCFGESIKTDLICCVLNPVIGNEKANAEAWATPAKPKKVMIAGGGPGGMQAALTAAQRGHDVTLFEKSEMLGGALKFAEHVDFKYDLFDFTKVMERKIKRAGVKIHTGIALTAQAVEELKPDVLFIATGAKPIIPGIEGIDSDNVTMASDVFGSEEKVGSKVVVIGGGLVGCETAAHLARMGKSVTIAEALPDIAADTDVFYKAAITVDMRKNGVTIMTNAKGVKVTNEGLIIENDGKTQLLEATDIICAVGYKPDTSLFEQLSDAAPTVQMIGDCKRPAKVTNAVTDAHFMALDIGTN
jgi:2,4-dienoyl-CoA reductase-like NADH-dependent reductase (Old Yellow Enzyme family)/thioredoxin reductase